MTNYNLESNMADRIRFDEDMARCAEAALRALSKSEWAEIEIDSYINGLWENEGQWFTDDPEAAREQGLTFVEDMEEAEHRFRTAARLRLESLLEEAHSVSEDLMDDAVQAILVQEHNGTYQIHPNARPEDWEVVKGEAKQVQRVESLAGWTPYTAAYRVTIHNLQPDLWYFVAE